MNLVLATIFLFFSLFVQDLFSFTFEETLYEGSSCNLDDEGTGICKKITDCPSRLKEVKMRLRNSSSKGRCGFSESIEIVCCPIQDLSQKIGIRPAELACRQYENEVNSDEVVFHIIDGQEAMSDEFPYMVALGYEDLDDNDKRIVKYDCGGTLISSQHVLTAAHCVRNIGQRVPVEVRMGSTDLRSETPEVQRIRVRNIVSHPRYKLSLVYNDVAIIRLQRPVRITEKVRPICLQTKPIARTLITVNASFIVIGWGATGFGEDNSPVLLKTPSMSLIERKNCSSSYVGHRRLSRGLDEGMICAMDTSGKGQADACQGDSGGPLLMISRNSQTIVGITSFGQICGTSVPAVYMSVYTYVDWIESVVWPEINRK